MRKVIALMLALIVLMNFGMATVLAATASSSSSASSSNGGEASASSEATATDDSTATSTSEATATDGGSADAASTSEAHDGGTATSESAAAADDGGVASAASDSYTEGGSATSTSAAVATDDAYADAYSCSEAYDGGVAASTSEAVATDGAWAEAESYTYAEGDAQATANTFAFNDAYAGAGVSASSDSDSADVGMELDAEVYGSGSASATGYAGAQAANGAEAEMTGAANAEATNGYAGAYVWGGAGADSDDANAGVFTISMTYGDASANTEAVASADAANEASIDLEATTNVVTIEDSFAEAEVMAVGYAYDGTTYDYVVIESFEGCIVWGTGAAGTTSAMSGESDLVSASKTGETNAEAEDGIALALEWGGVFADTIGVVTTDMSLSLVLFNGEASTAVATEAANGADSVSLDMNTIASVTATGSTANGDAVANAEGVHHEYAYTNTVTHTDDFIAVSIAVGYASAY